MNRQEVRRIARAEARRSQGRFVVPLTSYIESPQKFTQQDIHGGIDALTTADTLNSSTPISVSKMSGKLLFVVNAGSDLVGSLTISGTSVNRDTGVETGSDSESIPIDGASTDNSDTDANSNPRHDIENGYISSKWWTGSITISTTDLNISDVDVYHISFEQCDDFPTVTIDTIDVNAYATNASAWLYVYLYSVVVSGSTVTIAREASIELPASKVYANTYARARRGSLDVSLDGSRDGLFVNLFLGPSNQTYWEDLTLKVWTSITLNPDDLP